MFTICKCEFPYNKVAVFFFPFTEMEKKLSEERATKQKVENCLLEVEKRCSMLDCDLKQSQQKINELLKQKDKLSEDVSINFKKKSILIFATLHLLTAFPPRLLHL